MTDVVHLKMVWETRGVPGRVRVLVDGTVVSAHLKGAGRFIVGLVPFLSAVDGVDLIVAAHDEGILAFAQASVDIARVEHASGRELEGAVIPTLAASVDADLVFTVRERVPGVGPPVLMHIFELPLYRLRTMPRSRTSARSWSKNLWLHAKFAQSLRNAAAVTSASFSTSNGIAARYGIRPEVVYAGLGTPFSGPVTVPDDLRGAPFFLHPASGDSRENSALVVRAFAECGAPECRLRIFGPTGAHTERLLRLAARLGVEDRVVVEGWVSDERLRALYSAALALVHPSKYEGLAGYAVLEAMAIGTPTIVLRAPGVGEELEGAVCLVESPTPRELGQAMRAITEDPFARAELGSLGKSFVSRMDWTAASRQFADVFRRVSGR